MLGRHTFRALRQIIVGVNGQPAAVPCPGTSIYSLGVMSPAQPNQSILTGLDVLQEVIAIGRPIGSREVARRLGIEHSRANRILGTLVSGGMLHQNGQSKYLPGPRIHVLSALSLHASGLVTAALPQLAVFLEEGATVALGTLWRDTVVYLLHANPGDNLAATAGAHQNYPRDKSIIGSLFDLTVTTTPGLSTAIWIDRKERNERSWAARIPDGGTAAIAIVLSADHPAADPPEAMLQRVAAAAARIAAALA